MPDFLHEAAPTASQPEAASGASKRFRPGQPSAAEEGSDTDGTSKRGPSGLWTEYYGAAVLLLIAAFLGVGYVLLNPLVTRFKELNRDIESQTIVLQDERAYLDSLDQSIAAAEAIPSDTLEKVNEALPREIGIPKLLETMSRIADQNRVSLNSVQFNKVTAEDTAALRGKTIRIRPIDMNIALLSPGYVQTRAFLEDLETNLRVLDVKNIAVNANEQTGELTYNILLTAYSIEPIPKGVAAPGAPTP